MKLIEVNAAKEFANTFLGDPIMKMAVNAVLDHAPAANAVTVKKGHWKYGIRAATCSECGFERHLDDNFGRAISCPNCGSAMT